MVYEESMGYMGQVPGGCCLRSERRHGLIKDMEIRGANSLSLVGIVALDQLCNLPPGIGMLFCWMRKKIRDE